MKMIVTGKLDFPHIGCICVRIAKHLNLDKTSNKSESNQSSVVPAELQLCLVATVGTVRNLFASIIASVFQLIHGVIWNNYSSLQFVQLALMQVGKDLLASDSVPTGSTDE